MTFDAGVFPWMSGNPPRPIEPRFSRFGGGTGSPKPGEHHEHQQPWPTGPRQ